MFANLTKGLDIHTNALVLRGERQRIIASNIANADTPGYTARDLNFKNALSQTLGKGLSELSGAALSQPQELSGAVTNARHLSLSFLSGSQLAGASNLAYVAQTQPSADGNSVDLDRERANFVDNSVRYEATLRFINGRSRTLLSAIQGQ